MPLLILARRIAGAERISAADIFDAPAESVIAQGRLVLCALSLIAIEIDPTEPARYARMVLGVLSIYSAVALMLAVATFRNFSSPRARLVIHCGDIVAIALLLLLTDGSVSPFFAFFAFTLLAATLRWDWPGVVATAVALVVVLLAVSVQASSSPTVPVVDELDLNRAIIRGTYLMVAGAMLAYVSAYRARSHERLARLARWSARGGLPKTNPSFADALAHAASVLEARRVLVLWEEGEEPDLNVALWQQDTYRRSREVSGLYGGWISHTLHDATFIANSPASDSVQLKAGSVRVKLPILDPHLAAKFEIGAYATAAFAGAICRGRVFVLDRERWTEDHLLLTDIVAARIGVELDREALQIQTEQAVISRERARLMRDLHDGILQSLTAARLQLKMSADDGADDVRKRLDIVGQLLAYEQRRIRSFVDAAGPNPPKADRFRSREDVARFLSETGRLWDCNVALSTWPGETTLPPALGVQLSFLLAESVANAVRHGAASKVGVGAQASGDQLILDVWDNGTGFVVSDDVIDMHRGSVGVAAGPVSIRRRVMELGGSLDVMSSPDGAKLRIRLPMA